MVEGYSLDSSLFYTLYSFFFKFYMILDVMNNKCNGCNEKQTILVVSYFSQ